MTDKERLSQLEELVSETLRRLDILTDDVSSVKVDVSSIKADVASIRTAQLRTMQIVAGNTEAISLMLDKFDRQDAFNAKQETFNSKQEIFNAKQEAFNTKQEAFNLQLQETLQLILKRLDEK